MTEDQQEKYNGYKELVAIADANKLDEEFMQQPQLVSDVLDECAASSLARDVAANELKGLMAAMASEMRQDVDEKGKSLWSEAAINSELECKDEVVEARNNLATADYDKKMWEGLAEAYKQKGYAMRELSGQIVSKYLTPNSAQEYEENRKAMAIRRGAS